MTCLCRVIRVGVLAGFALLAGSGAHAQQNPPLASNTTHTISRDDPSLIVSTIQRVLGALPTR